MEEENKTATSYTNDENEVVCAKVLRLPSELGPNQIYFRPCLVYQNMIADHVADKGLEFRVNMETGINQARFSGENFGTDFDQNLLETNQEKKREILEKQFAFVMEKDGRCDFDTIKSKLLTAAAFGNVDLMRQLICTTYCTRKIGNQVLNESVKEGNVDIVKLLLDCEANPGYQNVSLDNRTSLHFAASIGHEQILVLLLENLIKNNAQQHAYLKTSSSGLNMFEILREEKDLGMMAKRLERLLV